MFKPKFRLALFLLSSANLDDEIRGGSWESRLRKNKLGLLV